MELSNCPIERIQPGDYREAAEVVSLAQNHWDANHGREPSFPNGIDDTLPFCEIYGELDPGCGFLVKDPESTRILGLCFFRERQTHFGLGVLAVHPNHFGKGIGTRLTQRVVALAQEEDKPVRMLSLAGNNESYSLFSKFGFSPYGCYQAMKIKIPENGFSQEQLKQVDSSLSTSSEIRPATTDDITEIVSLEHEILGIKRKTDIEFIVENTKDAWISKVVSEGTDISGYLVSMSHKGMNWIGPGVSYNQRDMMPLIVDHLKQYKGTEQVVLVSTNAGEIIRQLYDLDADHWDVYFGQVRGDYEQYDGYVLTSGMPESG